MAIYRVVSRPLNETVTLQRYTSANPPCFGRGRVLLTPEAAVASLPSEFFQHRTFIANAWLCSPLAPCLHLLSCFCPRPAGGVATEVAFSRGLPPPLPRLADHTVLAARPCSTCRPHAKGPRGHRRRALIHDTMAVVGLAHQLPRQRD